MKSKASKEHTLRRMNQDPEAHARLKSIADGHTGEGDEGKAEAKAALNASRTKPSRLKKSHIVPQKPEGKPVSKVKRAHGRY